MERNQGYLNSSINTYLAKVYGYMTGGLIITALTSIYTVMNTSLLERIYTNPGVLLTLVIAQLVLVFMIAGFGTRISTGPAAAAFLVYSVLNGLTLSYIFILYAGSAIISAFVVSAVTFGIMSIYGSTTKKDLTSIGRLGFMALIGIIISSLVNVFLLKSSGFELIISIITVIVFVGLIAYDTQKLKQYYYVTGGTGNVALIGALNLYIDFINLFLNILRIFSRFSRN